MVLDGMLEAVGSDGYEATSVAAVSARADVHRQAFYDTFGSKQECFGLAYAHGLELVEAVMVESARRERDWLGRLRAGLRALLGFLDAEPAVGRALIVEVQAGGGAALSEREAAMTRAMDFLAGGREAARAVPGTPTAPPIAPEAIASGIHEVLRSRLAGSEANGFRELLPELMFVAVLPYFGPEAARAEMGTGA
jgi:AcrR family transcriptional regulator